VIEHLRRDFNQLFPNMPLANPVLNLSKFPEEFRTARAVLVFKRLNWL
jgi:hypothetical protein